MAIIKGTALDDVLTSEAGLDTITGVGGNDVFVVAAPADHPLGEAIDGGAGYDRLWFSSVTGGDTLVLRVGVKGIERVEIANAAGDATGAVALNVDASALAAISTGFTLNGNAGANILTGTKGNDLINGGAGADSIVGGLGNDLIYGGAGVDTITGGLGNDRIVMSVVAADRDQIDAGDLPAEINTLVLTGAAAGIAMINLGVGPDLDQLTAFGAAPEAVVQSDFNNVDASAMTAFGLNVTASLAKNVLAGGVANDVFVYAAPTHITSDVVSGGGGSDAVHFASTITGQTLTLGAAVNVERALIADAAGVTTGMDEVNLSASAVAQKIELVGNDGINKLTGSAFADTMNGNGGADSLAGGAGNDLYVADSGGDWVALDKISDSAGTDDRIVFTPVVADTLVLSVGITGIEAVWTADVAFNILGTAALDVNGAALKVGMAYVGNAGANLFTGGIGNDTFTGNAGTDSIVGGAGSDVVFMDVETPDQADGGSATAAEANTLKLEGDAVAALEFDLSVAADADQSATLGQVQADFSHIDATELGVSGIVVTHSLLFNQLTGSDQDDVFVVLTQAHLGTDKIDGLEEGVTPTSGDRLRFAEAALVAKTLMLTASIKGVEIFEIADASGDTSGLIGHGINAAAMTKEVMLIGNNGANLLTGTKFGDTLKGGAGADTLAGGLEADTYLYDVSGDFVPGALGEKITDAGGSDTIKFVSTAGGDVLVVTGVTGIEFYELEAADLSSTGFDLSALAATAAASVTGNDGDNLLKGTKGNDTILGNKGDDTIEGREGADSIEGGEGVDSILGGLGADLVVVDVDEMDALDLGAVLEKNTLYLTGAGVETIDLRSLVDQVAAAGVQIGISYVDASRMDPGIDPEDLGVFVIGRDTQPGGGDFIVGSPRNDEFHPGRGADTIEGGGGHDVWYVFSVAEFAGDVYNDSGGTRRDYLYFDLGPAGGTITVQDTQVNGVDVGSAGFGPADTAPININVSAMNESFSMAGNAGKNILTGTRFGETIFDWGGADNMMGGDGSDEYVIVIDWVYDAPGVPGDRINDMNGFDDLYNATDVVLVVDRDHIKGIERFVVSDADIAIDPQPGSYSRNILVTNPGGIDAHDLTYGIHLAGNYGDNLLIGSASTTLGDTIFGYAGNDTIEGRQGNDDIHMDVGELAGSFGDPDMIDAGLGSDRLFLRGAPTGDVVVDLLLADQVVSINNLAETLVQTGFENFVDASLMERPSGDTIDPDANFGVHLKGRNTGKDTLIGTNEDDLFTGRDGADSLVGLNGDDTFVVLSLADIDAGEIMAGGSGEDTLRFASNDTLPSLQTLTLNLGVVQEIEAVVIGDEIGGGTTGTTALNVNAAAVLFGMTLVGNDGANLLTGTKFADTIIGNGGADTLKGGLGDDFYEIEAGAHVVALDRVEDTGGLDTVRFTSSTDGDAVVLLGVMTGIEEIQIWDGAEDLVGNLHLALDAGAVLGPLNLTGNKFNNTITGGAGNDTIDGLLGNDSIVGGGGADRILSTLVDVDADDVNAGLTSEGNTLVLSGELTLGMIWDLTSGTDQLVSVHTADRVFRGITHLDLTLLTGDFGATITGTADANTLMTGNFDDVFITETPFVAGERILAREGVDELRFTSTTGGQVLLLSALITGLEKVLISDALGDTSGLFALSVNAAAIATALEITGNAGNNALTGTGKADTIIGGGGVDTIVGGGGADEIKVTADTALSQAVGGALAEGNRLFIDGTLATALTVNLKLTTDQITGAGDTATQSGFAHLDASEMTAASISVTGSDVGNLIKGTAGADSIDGGKGADTIGVHVDGGDDTIVGGLLTEANELVLLGAGAATVDLSAVDQITSLGGNQGGFTHLDASAVTGAGVTVIGSAAGNRIIGTALLDDIDGGLGADTISWDAGTPGDNLDGGNLGDGDLLVVTGTAAGTIAFNLLTAPEADQMAGVTGLQSDFQHIDAGKLEAFGINARGNGLNNKLTGTVKSDTLIGMGGADTFVLGGGAAGDDMLDWVVYEARSDGANSIAALYGFDRIKDFDVGIDEIRFVGGELNTAGSAFNLDDIGTDNNIFSFATDAKADFSTAHEALYISAAKSKLLGEAPLTALATAAAAIAKIGIVAAAGDDGLIVLQSTTRAGFYYYQESDGIANSVSATELILLGLVETPANKDDFAFG